MGQSAEHTHEGDLVRETEPIVVAPPQGDLAAVGLEKVCPIKYPKTHSMDRP